MVLQSTERNPNEAKSPDNAIASVKISAALCRALGILASIPFRNRGPGLDGQRLRACHGKPAALQLLKHEQSVLSLAVTTAADVPLRTAGLASLSRQPELLAIASRSQERSRGRRVDLCALASSLAILLLCRAAVRCRTWSSARADAQDVISLLRQFQAQARAPGLHVRASAHA